MNSSRLLLLLVTFLSVAVGHAEPVSPIVSAAAKPAAANSVAATSEKAPERHPLRGVVIEVMADKSALLVKHEAIPGVMKAMTMLLKVDAAGLSAVSKGSPITGLLVNRADGWWLDAVQLAK